MGPFSTFTEEKPVAVFYTFVTPMLNPIIYPQKCRGENHHEEVVGQESELRGGIKMKMKKIHMYRVTKYAFCFWSTIRNSAKVNL